MTQISDREFECEVRRIARSLWPSAAYGGAQMEDGKERDGVFVTDDVVHLVEATTSKRKDKASQDAGKIASLAKTMRKRFPLKALRGWIVTAEDPTADQRKVVQKHQDLISIVSFDQFKSKIIDARQYLDLRETYPFGSARNPDSGDHRKLDDYVAIDLVEKKSNELNSIEDVSVGLSSGRKFVFLGDFGSGKSMTFRELFRVTATKFRKGEVDQFPVVLNLRDHHGQTNPAEALERHARNIGFPHPNHLVRGWRAGTILLFLDGFDEIATAGWTSKTKKLRDLRYTSMQLVREFFRGQPSNSGLAISGRAHFFDSINEMTNALGLPNHAILVDLGEFTDEQIQAYLAERGWKEGIPSWLPSRPLLLGHLASRGLLKETIAVESGVTPARAWDSLLQRICEREAEIEAGIDPDTVRSLIENLASRARKTFDGVGPLAQEEIVESFKDVCGYSPDDRGVVLLQRLPGLAPASESEDSRVFIDKDYVDAARAGDIRRFIEDPFNAVLPEIEEWQCSLGRIGVELTAGKCTKKITGKRISNSMSFAQSNVNSDILVFDVLRILISLGFSYDGDTEIVIGGMLSSDLILLEDIGDISRITFKESLISNIEIDPKTPSKFLPNFVGCFFENVEGRVGKDDLPIENFDENCVFDEFTDSAETTSKILSLSIPSGTKVMLTILKKLYIQRGSGRREQALSRGLDHRDQRLVDDVLALLRNEGVAYYTKAGAYTIWHPVRNHAGRIRRLLASPNLSKDPLFRKSADID